MNNLLLGAHVMQAVKCMPAVAAVIASVSAVRWATGASPPQLCVVAILKYTENRTPRSRQHTATRCTLLYLLKCGTRIAVVDNEGTESTYKKLYCVRSPY